MSDVQNALKRSVQTEKNAMNYYQIAAKHMKDAGAIKTFELLASEEREHAKQFFDSYTGDDLPSFEDFINAPPENESDWLSDLEKAIAGGLDERKAMELAMDKEQKLEESLREMASKVSDPAVAAIFEANAKSTQDRKSVV